MASLGSSRPALGQPSSAAASAQIATTPSRSSRAYVGRRRTVKAASSRPASATRAAARASIACHSAEIPRHPMRCASAIVVGAEVEGVQPARPRRSEPPDAFERRRLERRHDRPLETRPAARPSGRRRRRAPGRPSAPRRGTLGAGWPPAPPRASGTPWRCELVRAERRRPAGRRPGRGRASRRG